MKDLCDLPRSVFRAARALHHMCPVTRSHEMGGSAPGSLFRRVVHTFSKTCATIPASAVRALRDNFPVQCAVVTRAATTRLLVHHSFRSKSLKPLRLLTLRWCVPDKVLALISRGHNRSVNEVIPGVPGSEKRMVWFRKGDLSTVTPTKQLTCLRGW